MLGQALFKRLSLQTPFSSRAYSAIAASELYDTTDVDPEVEFVPNIRRAPNHRVDLTGPDRRNRGHP